MHGGVGAAIQSDPNGALSGAIAESEEWCREIQMSLSSNLHIGTDALSIFSRQLNEYLCLLDNTSGMVPSLASVQAN